MRLRLLLAALVPVLVVVATACSDEEPKRPPISESGSGGPSGGGGGGTNPSDAGSNVDTGDAEAGVCTDLPITGEQIPQQVVIGDVPAGTGGTLVDGVYDITDATLFGGPAATPGPSGASYQGSIRITGATFERHMIFRTVGGAVVETVVRGTISTGVSSLIALACPVAAQEQITYTVSGNNLTLANLVSKESLGFTKRP